MMNTKQINTESTNNADKSKNTLKVEYVNNASDDSKQDSLSQFFAAPNDAASIPIKPFKFNLFNLLKAKNRNLFEMVRVSCKLMTENSKYIDIDYEYLPQYAALLNNAAIDNYVMNKKDWEINMEDTTLSERDIINISCFFVVLQIGYGFRKTLAKHCKNDASVQIGIGVQNMYTKYPKLDCHSLNKITTTEISQLFQIPSTESVALQLLCDMLRSVIQEVVDTLSLKNFNSFSDYIYYHIDLCWIKSQTKNLSAIETIDFVINDENKLGLTLCPTKSNIVRRCVVTDFKSTNDDDANCENNKNLQRLIEQKAFIYAINDEVVYKRPFDEIICKIQERLKNEDVENRGITLQFGLHLEDEGNTIDTLLYNVIADFKGLRDVYLYKSLFNDNKNLKIYLFQRAQLIVMELYYNLFLRVPNYVKKKNPIFNFKDMSSLTAVVDNVIPFVLMKDKVIKIKNEYKEEWKEWIKSDCILKTGDLEIELRASALWAIELLLNYRKSIDNDYDINATKFTYYLWTKGKGDQYIKFAKHHTRDTIYY